MFHCSLSWDIFKKVAKKEKTLKKTLDKNENVE